MNKNLKEITEPSIKGVFTKWIKKQLKKWLNDDKTKRCMFLHAVYIYYDGEDYCVDFGVNTIYDADTLKKAHLSDAYVCGTDPFIEGGIVVSAGGVEFIDRDRAATEKELTSLAHWIIQQYNMEVF